MPCTDRTLYWLQVAQAVVVVSADEVVTDEAGAASNECSHSPPPLGAPRANVPTRSRMGHNAATPIIALHSAEPMWPQGPSDLRLRGTTIDHGAMTDDLQSVGRARQQLPG